MELFDAPPSPGPIGMVLNPAWAAGVAGVVGPAEAGLFSKVLPTKVPPSMNAEFDGDIGHQDRCRDCASIVGWNWSSSR